jgi:hypothetical protein
LNKHLHIITLNIPDPPDYGGMIDSFYRIRALINLGIHVHLHSFEYGRPHSEALESICDTVNYYRRKSGLQSYLSVLPEIVFSRKTGKLIDNLSKDDYPVLFDGLHTTYHINHSALTSRKKIVRVHNIEHQYYLSLGRAESNLVKKLYFYIESIKLKRYEFILSKADFILTVSETDQEYFENNYHNSFLISSFHPFSESVSITGKGNYAIYHGDLSVKENEIIAEWLIRDVFSKLQYPLIIAGKNPSVRLQKAAMKQPNIKIYSNPDSGAMVDLIRNSHIQVLPALSTNGLKIKLLFGLFAGRHCIINSKMAKCIQTPELCNIADSGEEIIEKIRALINVNFTMEMIRERQKILDRFYSNSIRAKQMANLLFPDYLA